MTRDTQRSHGGQTNVQQRSDEGWTEVKQMLDEKARRQNDMHDGKAHDLGQQGVGWQGAGRRTKMRRTLDGSLWMDGSLTNETWTNHPTRVGRNSDERQTNQGRSNGAVARNIVMLLL